MTPVSLGIIGCGNMAAAILQAVLARGLLPRDQVTACDRFEEKTQAFAGRFGIRAEPRILRVVEASGIVLFAVKPQDAKAVFTQAAPYFRAARKTAVSIIAGLPMAAIAHWLTANAVCNESEIAAATALFAAGGVCLPATESHFDAVTALSGSGPAYLFLFMEALTEAAAQLALPTELIQPLVMQTLRGALSLAERSGDAPAHLREQVTSKGGTTEAALARLEAAHFRTSIAEALQAAKTRSEELSHSLFSDI